MKKVLIVETNSYKYAGTNEATGLWLGESAEFVDELYKHNIEVDFVSPLGGFVPLWQFKVAKLFSKKVRELDELLPRYEVDNIFVSNKFKKTFPNFKITSFETGISQMLTENSSK